MDNIFCIECGFELPGAAKFCLKCGGKIPEIVISDPEITKEENIESESKPITQTPIKTTPKTSKAMAIGTTLLEWIIVFVVAFLVGGIAGLIFEERTGSVIGFIAFLGARAVIRSILKSILPLRYQDETYEEVKIEEEDEDHEDDEIEEDEIEEEINKEEIGYNESMSRKELYFLSFIALIGIVVLIVIIAFNN